MKLYIKRLKDETLIIEAEPSDTVEQLKVYIYEKTQIPIDEQRLIKYGGKILEDMRPLSDYNFTDGTTIFFQLKGGICYCFLKYGEKKFRISKFCCCCSNTLYLKKQASLITGTKPSNLELIVDGKIMEDSKSLDNYDIIGNEIEIKVKK